ncbi:hypothetical protein HELRODRAFT_171207 [Helobdella robusta]|uniref:Uncharacterized protein n=1 Tax=Helobdella robusta TaxID=6412 RepID=T1F3X9_HELRO|nr:hypothetical protein HELRODRAFT_171207 [Helobdella robusta]ESO05566.1 hypothetical protein HELRODRAFT_171207 [Helobdella robusta]
MYEYFAYLNTKENENVILAITSNFNDVEDEYLTNYRFTSNEIENILHKLKEDRSPEIDTYFLKLKNIHSKIKVIIVCHSNQTVFRKIMFFAQDLGMTDPDNYVWITFYNIYLGLPFDALIHPWSATNDHLPENDYRRKAFLSLKIVCRCNGLITYKNVTPISYISNDATQQSLDDIFYLYLVLRNQTLSSNKDPKSGSNILNSAKLNQIMDKNETVKFNFDGDRLMNFYVWTLAPDATTFAPYMEINMTNESAYSVGAGSFF